jgi:uncharacterized protein (TIGR02452 family)
MNRTRRAAMGEETLRILEAGYYDTAASARVQIKHAVAEAVRNARLFRDADFPARLAPTPRAVTTRIDVTDETTLSAARRLAATEGRDTLILNFASARNPGGGFLSGSEAQEESLARSSALYACQMAHFAFYEHNRARPTLLYSDWMIHAPHVPVFRDDDGTLLDAPYYVAMLTSPAVNAGAVRANAPQSMPLIAPTNENRARRLLWLANAQGHTHLILGAWGCGVFGNDPADIAQMFARLLHGEFQNAFAGVTFAIYDRIKDQPALRAFEAAFSQGGPAAG